MANIKWRNSPLFTETTNEVIAFHYSTMLKGLEGLEQYGVLPEEAVEGYVKNLVGQSSLAGRIIRAMIELRYVQKVHNMLYLNKSDIDNRDNNDV